MEFLQSGDGSAFGPAVVRGNRHLADWSAVGERAHVVQFYEEDGTLIELLSRYVGVALVAGDSAVVIATKKHRDGIVSRLGERGLDVSIARSQGRYVSLDAAQTLAKFFRDGRPDSDRFTQLMGEVVDSAARAANGGRHRVVTFGEVVALLWAQGKVDAALRIEELWNRLAERHNFSLCCAYPMNGFVGNPHAAPFLKICAQHSHVFPAERKVRSTLAGV
jgi:hypothetical protein